MCLKDTSSEMFCNIVKTKGQNNVDKRRKFLELQDAKEEEV